MSLIGHGIADSEIIRKAVDGLTAEVIRHNTAIKGIKAADPQFADRYVKQMERVGQLRGRPLHYPFIGTGAGRGNDTFEQKSGEGTALDDEVHEVFV